MSAIRGIMFSYSFVCKTGGRPHNQDSIAALERGGCYCFAVCDGLGAYSGSGTASRLCVDTVKARLGDEPLSEEGVIRMLRNAHDSICEIKSRDASMEAACTTFAGIFADGEKTVIAHIGDSRVYRFADGVLVSCTADHSVAQRDVERGKIERKDLGKHKDQNKLTRVLGGKYFVRPDIHLLPAPHFGDVYVICSDGFWEYVPETLMTETVRNERDAARKLEILEKRLLEEAVPGHDNYSAIVAIAEKESGCDK